MMEKGSIIVQKYSAVKVIAEVLCVISAIWLTVSIAGDKWVTVRFQYQEEKAWTWGILVTCNILDDELHVCVSKDWTAVCLVFSIVSVILSLAATACGILAIKFTDNVKSRRVYYIIAAGFMSLVAVLQLMVVSIFPVKFGEDISRHEFVRRWDFDWTYGFAWGGLIFSVGSAIFFVLPNDSRPAEGTTFYSKEYT